MSILQKKRYMTIYKKQLEMAGFDIYDRVQLRDFLDAKDKILTDIEKYFGEDAHKEMRKKGSMRQCTHFIVKGSLCAKIVMRDSIVTNHPVLHNFGDLTFKKDLDVYMFDVNKNGDGVVFKNGFGLEVHQEEKVYTLIQTESKWKRIGSKKICLSATEKPGRKLRVIFKAKKASPK